MPRFTDPIYASYVALCRELRLEHVPAFGELYWEHLSRAVWMVGEEDMGEGERWWPEDGDVWLPQLSDWLDMIAEKLGPAALIGFCRWSEGDWVAADIEYETFLHRANAPTREEAAARLAIAVGAVKVPA